MSDAACQCTALIEVSIKKSYYVKGNIEAIVCAYDSDGIFLEGKQFISYLNHPTEATLNNFVLPANTKYIRASLRNNNYNYQIVEGTQELPYEPYHKADFSNIQHAGELYVDEDGNEILDKLGRKQYRFDIISTNDIIYDFKLEKGRLENDGSALTNTHNQFRSSEFVKVIFRHIYITTFGGYEGPIQLLCYDKNKNFLNINLNCAQNSLIIIPDNAVYFKITSRNFLPDEFDYMFTTFKCVGTSSILNTYYPRIENKQTILLPCQLMRNGDTKDRLFWNNQRNVYIVEKNIDRVDMSALDYTFYRETDEWILSDGVKYGGPSRVYTFKNPGKGLKANNKHLNSDVFKFSDISCFYNGLTADGKAVNKIGLINPSYIRIENSICGDSTESFLRWIKNSNLCYYTVLEVPQYIETTITECIDIPTYNSKLHIYVNNYNNAKPSIKAKFPLKTASVAASLTLNSTKNTEDINALQDLNVDMMATSFDMDYRLLEVE